MEFKGTKGKWVINYQDGSWLVQDLETYQDGHKSALAEVYYFNDGKDTAEANALLISKAPEILESLKDLVSYLEAMHGAEDTECVEMIKAKQLIKQATEL